LFKDFRPGETYERNVQGATWRKTSPEVFLDELKEGMLVHARSVLPHETQYISVECTLNATSSCTVGFLCPDSTEFVDELHKKNVFTDSAGRYCNCWRTARIEDFYVPQLEAAITQHTISLREQQ
jgi:hypothetical protein